MKGTVAASSQTSPAGPPATPRRPNRVPTLLVALLLLAGVAVASWVFRGALPRPFAAGKHDQPATGQSLATVRESSQPTSTVRPEVIPTTELAAGKEAAPFPATNPAIVGASEYAIKAAFLVKFAENYVNWPSSAFPAADSPFCIGILGNDPFGSVLDEMCKGIRIGSEGRKIVIKRSSRVDELNTCQMVFASKSESHVTGVLFALGGSSVLTVGESRGFTARGGMINFYIADGKVRFEINNEAAIRHNITINRNLIAMSAPQH